ncbi:hypothetical protein M758_3G180500 [Ceratodon purpureus]|nr:hypothetical protein M758_3G180500 [Ceratodon purpureus]
MVVVQYLPPSVNAYMNIGIRISPVLRYPMTYQLNEYACCLYFTRYRNVGSASSPFLHNRKMCSASHMYNI